MEAVQLSVLNTLDSQYAVSNCPAVGHCCACVCAVVLLYCCAVVRVLALQENWESC